MNCSERRLHGTRAPGDLFARALCAAVLLAVIAHLGWAPRPLATVDALAAKAKHEIKIATLAPEGSTWMNIMKELDTEVRKSTGDVVGLKFYPGGIQGDEPVVLRKIRTGQLHGAGFTGVGLGEIAPSLRVLELPFLFENASEVAALHDRMDPVFEAKLEEAGFTLLGWADVGFVYLYSKQPIATTEGLKAQKMWLWEGDPLARTFLQAAGVSPVPLSISDVMTSLQTGLITAVYTSPLACIALQWFTRVAYTTDTPITHAMGAVVVSNKEWEKIPADAAKVTLDLCETYFAKLRIATLAEDRESARVIGERGVETVTPSADEVERFRAIGERVAEDLAGDLYPEAILQQVRRELSEIRAQSNAGSGENGVSGSR